MKSQFKSTVNCCLLSIPLTYFHSSFTTEPIIAMEYRITLHQLAVEFQFLLIHDSRSGRQRINNRINGSNKRWAMYFVVHLAPQQLHVLHVVQPFLPSEAHLKHYVQMVK